MMTAQSTLSEFEAKAKANSNELCATMITYPSTHGVFEATVKSCERDNP